MKLNLEYSGITKKEIEKYKKEVIKAHEKIHEGTGEGSDFLGWVNLKINVEELEKIKVAASKIRKQSDVLIVIGIGGSYLGSKAVIDALSHSFNPKSVIFAGNNMSPDYLNDLLDYIKDKDISLNVISKSGTTLEPAVTFKILREYLENKYGEDGARERIFVTTDKEKGVLKKLANEKGYETFVVPNDIGGRYSVFTAVGLLPIASSGINIEKLLSGVYDAQEKYKELNNNDCYDYAVARNILYKKKKNIELLVNYEPKLHFISEWWKQLFGESEGKDGKGLFPASVDNTTDLHSMGQYIQEGERILFETVIDIKKPYRDYTMLCDDESVDKLNYLNGKTLNEINHKAMEGTVIAHTKGKVPNILIEVDKIDEVNIGKLLYFFEKACGISGYLLGVNPFNQPGVEAYKSEMFTLLGK